MIGTAHYHHLCCTTLFAFLQRHARKKLFLFTFHIDVSFEHLSILRRQVFLQSSMVGMDRLWALFSVILLFKAHFWVNLIFKKVQFCIVHVKRVLLLLSKLLLISCLRTNSVQWFHSSDIFLLLWYKSRFFVKDDWSDNDLIRFKSLSIFKLRCNVQLFFAFLLFSRFLLWLEDFVYMGMHADTHINWGGRVIKLGNVCFLSSSDPHILWGELWLARLLCIYEVHIGGAVLFRALRRQFQVLILGLIKLNLLLRAVI